MPLWTAALTTAASSLLSDLEGFQTRYDERLERLPQSGLFNYKKSDAYASLFSLLRLASVQTQ